MIVKIVQIFSMNVIKHINWMIWISMNRLNVWFLLKYDPFSVHESFATHDNFHPNILHGKFLPENFPSGRCPRTIIFHLNLFSIRNTYSCEHNFDAYKITTNLSYLPYSHWHLPLTKWNQSWIEIKILNTLQLCIFI